MAQIKNLIARWDAAWPSPMIISRQYDNCQFRIDLMNYPEPEYIVDEQTEQMEILSYYLIVWMKETEDGEYREMSPIMLPGPYWIVPNQYTQLVQDIRFQFCVQSDSTDYEAHSAIFTGRIVDSIEHDGTAIDVIPVEMFDAYKAYIQEIAMAAGAVVIDPNLDTTGAAADAKAVGDAIKAGKTFVVQVPGSATVYSGSITAGDFAKALAAYTAGSGVYAVKDSEVYQLSAVSSSTMTFTQMYHGTMNFIKQIQITSADTFTVTNTALSSSAADTSYSNTASGLTATNVQAAIDESAAALSSTNERLGNAEVGVSALQEGAKVLYGASEEVNVSISAIPILTSGGVYVLEVIPALDREAVAVSVGTPDGQGREQSLGTFAFVTGVPIYITFTANGDWSRVRFPSVARNVSVNVYNFSVSDYFDSKISETNNKVETISDNVADIATIDTEIQDPTETVYNRDTLSVLTGYVATNKGNYKAKGDWNTVYVYTEESCLAVLNPSTTMTVSYGGYSSQEPAVGATVDKAIGVRNEDFPNTFEKALLVPANSYVYVNIPNTVTQHTITLYKGEFVKTYALNPQFSLTQAMREDVEGIIESKGSQQYGLSSDALLYRSLIPSYYGEVQAETPATFDEAYPYIENKINSIPSGKSFIFITDTHWAGNQKHSTQLINYIRKRTGIKKVVFGGDILGNEVTPQLFVKSGGAYLLESRQAFGSDYIPAVGDHDSNSNVRTGYTVEEQFLSYTEMERMFMGDLKNVAHVYQPTEKLAQYATGNNYNECLAFFKTVYYVDDNENEIRYIVLNNGNNGADYGAMHDVFGSSGSDVLRLQIDWLAETLMSTPEGYDIVVAAHKVNQGSSSGNTVLFLLNGFARAAASCKPAPSSVGSVIESWWPHTKSYNFAGRPNVGKIISINGHVHKDGTFWCGYDGENVYHRNEVYDGTTILNQTEYGQIPSISTQCDAAANVSSTGFPMTVGTVSEQCFDIITFTNDGVALTRIGAGEDRRYYTNA